MKAKSSRGRYRLSPNEEAQLLKEETEKRKKLRLVQVAIQKILWNLPTMYTGPNPGFRGSGPFTF